MIAALLQYESLAAIGVLARAALSIDDDGNPAAEPKLPNEHAVRSAIIKEVRKNLGINDDDVSDNSLERLGDALDEELAKLTGKTDINEILGQLADKGELPADLYEPILDNALRIIYEKHWYLIQDNIIETVRMADREQHFAPADDTIGDAPLLSLFAKDFHEKNPYDNFTMLVTGQRQGLKLIILQAWRLYPSEVAFGKAKDLVDILKQFSEVYGIEFNFNGKKSKFMLTGDLGENHDSNTNININPPIKTDKKGRKLGAPVNFTVTHFAGRRNNGTINSTLTVAIDIDKYIGTLGLHGW